MISQISFPLNSVNITPAHQNNSSYASTRTEEPKSKQTQALSTEIKQVITLIDKELDTVNKSWWSEALTVFPFTVLEVLWGIAEIYSGLISKFIYAATSTEELGAGFLVAKSLTSYKKQLQERKQILENILQQISSNQPLNNLSAKETSLLNAVKQKDLKTIFDSESNNQANKWIEILQKSVAVLLTVLAAMKFTGVAPKLFKGIEEHPIPKHINHLKNKAFSSFGKYSNWAEIGLLTLPMLIFSFIKHNLSKQTNSNLLSSTLKAESIANFTCSLEAISNVGQILINEGLTFSKLLPGLFGQGGLLQLIGKRNIREVIDLPLSAWMAWNYFDSASEINEIRTQHFRHMNTGLTGLLEEAMTQIDNTD
ncbi:MAG TPA: hypothetical protein V6C96_03200 [Vampirovibrionales bacterium]